MLDHLKWTRASFHRNRVTLKHEALQIKFVQFCLQRSDNWQFFDVGAHVGAYSILLATNSNVEAVYAFEPMPKAFHHLETNVHLNGLQSKIKCYGAAVSDKNAEVDFAVFGELSGSNGVQSSQTNNHANPASVTKVPAIALDEHFEMSNRSILLKLDVEGHEFQALEGARKLISSNNGIAQVELHKQNEYYPSILQFFEDAGWRRIFGIGPDVYFSNLASLLSHVGSGTIAEEFLSFAVANEIEKIEPIRRQIFRGVTIELSRRLVGPFYRWPRR